MKSIAEQARILGVDVPIGKTARAIRAMGFEVRPDATDDQVLVTTAAYVEAAEKAGMRAVVSTGPLGGVTGHVFAPPREVMARARARRHGTGLA